MATDRLPIHEARTFSGDRDLEADVVVVGSGAGGAVAAYELARAGKRVVVLEAGPYVPSTEFTERHVDALEQLFQDRGLQGNTDGDLTVLQGRCVGGSTVVNAAAAFRTPDDVLEVWRTEHGLTDLTPERLQPLFERVERNVSVHENEAHERGLASRILEEGCNALGWSHRPLRRNVKACLLTGYCLAGCATDRKQSMLVTYLPWAVHHGAEIYADTTVDRVLLADGRAVGVSATVRDPDSGRRVGALTVRASVVVVAAGAIQSPLLLLRSDIPDPAGLIGQHFACHPSLMMLGETERDVYGWKGATLGSYCDEFEPLDKGGFLIEFGMPAPDFAGVFPLPVGPDFLDIMGRMRRMVSAVSLVHDRNDGSVSYSEHGTKRIAYRISPHDRPIMADSLRRMAQLFFAAGCTRVHLCTTRPTSIDSAGDIDRVVDGLDFAPGTMALTTYHPQGTLRMGADPMRSVVGPRGEVHTVRGLFVTDASVFPTSIMVNPQITVYTLATLIAEQLLSRWGAVTR